MKLRSRWLIALVAWLAALALRALLSTLRVRTRSADGRAHPVDPAEGPLIYAFWHESILAMLTARAKATVMISQSRDGELIAQTCQRLKIGVTRGSSTRGGAKGLLEMVRGGQGGHLAITPDGPRGPRRKTQLGVVALASCTGMAIVPVGVGFVRAWRARSWDRFAVPLPWSAITGVFGEPIVVPAGLHGEALSAWRQRVEEAMLAATQAAEQWALEIESRHITQGKEPCHHEAQRNHRDSAGAARGRDRRDAA